MTAFLSVAAQSFPPAAGPIGDNKLHPIPGAGHDYIHLLSETVNPANGSLSINIRMPAPAGRGIDPPAVFRYNSGEISALTQVTGVAWATSPANPLGQANGWGSADSTALTGSASAWNFTSPPTPQGYSAVNCSYISAFHFYDLNGTAHNLAEGVEARGQNADPRSTCNPQQVFPPSLTAAQAWNYSDGETAALLDSNAVAELTAGDAVQIHAIDEEGNTYSFASPEISTQGPNQVAVFPSGIEDRNGNFVSQSGLSGTDTAGRAMTLQITPRTTPGTQTYTVYGLQYAVTTITTPVSYTAGPAQKTLIENTAYCATGATLPANTATINVISSIELPNNQTYTFLYDQTYGTIREIDYPDGGKVSYTWGFPSPSNYSQFSSFSASTLDHSTVVPNACFWAYPTPVVLARQVSYGGSSYALTQSFAYTTNWNSTTAPTAWTTKVTKVTSTDNVLTKASTVVYTYVPGNQLSPVVGTGCAESCNPPVEQTIQYYDWGQGTSGNPLDTAYKQWYNQFQLACEVHVLNGSSSLAYGHFYQYLYGQISDDKQFDVGQVSGLQNYCTASSSTPPSAAPLREVVTTLKSFASPVPPNLIFAKPLTATVLGLVGGTQVTVAETTYLYDEGTVSAVTGLIQHDENCFPGGSSPQTSPPCESSQYNGSPTLGRGNATTITRMCLSSACGGSADNSITKYQYDEAGQVVAETDACGNGSCSDMPAGSASSHTTSYSYADSYTSGTPPGTTDAYLTNISYPYSLQEKFAYDYTNGLLTSSTDENSRTTSYAYDDALNRLTSISHPDLGVTTYTYNDGTYTSGGTVPNVTIQVKQTNSVQTTTIARSDGIGHVWQAVLDDPVNTNVTSETTYDGEGHPYIKTNPHRASPASTDGSAYFYFDAMGRPIFQHQPDSSWLSWCYNGTAPVILPTGSSSICQGQKSAATGLWVDSTDETGREWQRTSDSFGRLLAVMEPNASNVDNIGTYYAYDALNDLLAVTQNGTGAGSVTRSFFYDSLGRLDAANNPETASAQYPPNQICTGISGKWTACYLYDLNGNVVSKVDNRGVFTYSNYDWIDRITEKSYSDSAGTATPWSCYQYDTSSVPGNVGSTGNFLGRLTNKWTIRAQNSCVPPISSGYLTLRATLAYDPMGRVRTDEQCTTSGCRTASPCSGSSYSYDLAGHLNCSSSVQLIPGLTSPLTFTSQYDGAGRLQTLSSSWANTQHPGTLFSETVPASSPCTQTPSYAGFGGLQNAVLGNGLALSRSYNSRLRPGCEQGVGSLLVNATAGSATISITGAEQSQ
jgi:YD repeat-containing protein